MNHEILVNYNPATTPNEVDSVDKLSLVAVKYFKHCFVKLQAVSSLSLPV